MDQYIFWCTLFNNNPICHKNNFGSHFTSKVNFMCHNYHRNTFIGNFLHNRKNFSNHFGIECRRRFVE